VQHDLCRLVFDVLDRVLAHDVVKGIVIEWKAPCRIQVDNRIMIEKDVAIQPSVENAVAKPRVGAFSPGGLLGSRLAVSVDKPNKRAHIHYQSSERFGQTNNEL